MDMGYKGGQMDHSKKVIGKKIIDMVRVSLYGVMEAIMKVISMMMLNKDMVSLCGVKVSINMKVVGLKI